MPVFRFCFFSIVFFLFFSCESTNFSVSDWRTPHGIDDLSGKWVSTAGEYDYPVVIGGKKYLRVASTRTDDTQLWKKYAESNDMDLSDLWLKRFSLSQSIYSSDDDAANLPEADANGTQRGRKYFIEENNEDEKIYSRLEMLIPESVLAINLKFFLIRRDGLSFREQGVFHLISDNFKDIRAGESLFYKMEGENHK